MCIRDSSTINAGAVTLGDANVEATLTINAITAADGDVVITGNANVGNVISLEATGDISLTTASAGNLFVSDADGDIIFDAVSNTNGNIQFTAGGAITGDTVETADIATNVAGIDAISFSAGGALQLNTVRAQDAATLSGASVDAVSYTHLTLPTIYSV